MAQQAIGMVETKGLVSLIEASDAMLKSANVSMLGWDKVGSGMVTCDVAAVKAAADAGAAAAGRVGEVIGVHIIARPHDELPAMLPKTPSKPQAK
jgi:ethanolamine utilization protein EutM